MRGVGERWVEKFRSECVGESALAFLKKRNDIFSFK